jgi:protein-tyrosine-phosphatase
VKEYDADITNHRAKRLTKNIVDAAEIILCMTENHKYQIAQVFPSAQDKSYTLLEYVNLYDQEHYNDTMDIPDPFGQQIEAYKKCAEIIYSALKIVYKQIKR